MQDLIGPAQNGEQESITELLTLTREYILACLRTKDLPNWTDTEDEADEVLIKIYKNLHKYDSSRAQYNTWVSNIVNYHFFDLLGKNKTRKIMLSATKEDGRSHFDDIRPDIPGPLDSVLMGKLRKDFLRAIGNISNKDQRNAVLLLILGIDNEEKCAKLLETTGRNTFASRLRLGYKKLISILKTPEYSNVLPSITFLIENSPHLISPTREELEFIEDEDQRRALEIAHNTISIPEAAETMGVGPAKFKELLQAALEVLGERLSTYRRIFVEAPEVEKCREMLPGYITSLFRYGLSASTRKTEVYPEGFDTYKTLTDALFFLFITPYLPPAAGNLVTGAIGERDLDREEIAEKLNISVDEFFRFLEDRSPLGKKELKKLAKITSIPPDKLLKATKLTTYRADE